MEDDDNIESSETKKDELRQKIFHLQGTLHNLHYELQQEHVLLRDSRDECRRMKSDCPNNYKPKSKLQEAVANELMVKKVYRGDTGFAYSVYKALAKKYDNIVFSPLIIRSILALTYTGAKDQTARELADGLYLPKDIGVVKSTFHDILLSYMGGGSTSIDFANKIFIDEKKHVEESFINVAEDSFFSEVQTVDFAKNSEEARIIINTWMEVKTYDKIKDLVRKDDISEETVMLLVNAVYFNNRWALKFPPCGDSVIEFFVRPEEVIELPLLHNTDEYKIAASDDLKAQILELPYESGNVSLMIVLPNKMDGLAHMEAVLCDDELKSVYQKLETVLVDVYLPKFTIEMELRLKSLLAKLGMPYMFDEDLVDFSRIARRSDRVHISEVIHKGVLEVEEEGTAHVPPTEEPPEPQVDPETESLVERENCGCEEIPVPPIPREFKADHPFLFIVVGKKTNTTLLMGRFTRLDEDV